MLGETGKNPQWMAAPITSFAPPRMESLLPRAALPRPPLTDAELPNAVLWRPPLTEEASPRAVLLLPPLVVA